MAQQTLPRNGRCQHCRQKRPLFLHDNWASFLADDTAWLCTRDYSAREEAIENEAHFDIWRDFDPFQADDYWAALHAALAAIDLGEEIAS
ncbi:hypothetical protein K378_01388 [Streptomyces sp. Amel2xB2]|uniref:hypothetical protein n=1 Tax=Streptomyces sp. Amel2xB2 TaxID=1305829 RepID=UPI000DB8FC77|nr:hypothetical protein [Streptomyces sp. Amel2xB2]RAJ70223.1 hypothetical protein K378_01388 [Streptomyces sp. Amel2xB2]